jgi:2-hydroxy-3-keto-5-methylthiopentenyl-1-phosphate phosphatase
VTDSGKPQHVLVSDFDGTMTRHDFYALVYETLLPATTMDYWTEYRAGRLTHFEALRGYFAAIRTDEEHLLRLVDAMQIDPQLATAVAKLHQAGWRVVVASAGCAWYIERLFAQQGVELEVHSNRGSFDPSRGLLMELPVDSPFFSPTHGIDKAAVVRHYQSHGARVAFAGDGFPDEEAARLVPNDLRFARGDLASVLTRSSTPFQSFERWSEIAGHLVARRSTP